MAFYSIGSSATQGLGGNGWSGSETLGKPLTGENDYPAEEEESL